MFNKFLLNNRRAAKLNYKKFYQNLQQKTLTCFVNKNPIYGKITLDISGGQNKTKTLTRILEKSLNL